MPIPLISTKCAIPSLRPGIVGRPRLVEKLNQGRPNRLTLISASAGFGKTTLLSEWITRKQPRVVWLSLDENDNDPMRFWAYSINALQGQYANIGSNALAMFHAPQAPPLETILTILINELEKLPQDITLVLDDYHLIEEQAIHSSLAFLLHHLPARLHLLIASRIDPPLPLSRLRTRGQMVEIRDADLRFTSEETHIFLQQVMNLPLSREDVATLYTHTEGWIAGLHLAALSLQHQDRPSHFVQNFNGGHRFVLDYLVDEVLYQQPESIQRFLLRTSILTRFTASLCEAVTGEPMSSNILISLERRNLFVVPLDNEREWYRYHKLFAEMLQARLLISHANEINALHLSAARWYEQQHLITEAVQHALASRDLVYAAELIKQEADALWMNGAISTLLNWLKALPEELIATDLELCLIYALVLCLGVKQAEATQLLEHVERVLAKEQDATKTNAEHTRLQGMLASVRSVLMQRKKNGPQTAHYAQQALACLPDEQKAWRLIPAATLGLAHQADGNMGLAYAAFREAREAAQQVGSRYFTLVSSVGCGYTLHWLGRSRQAQVIFEELQELMADHGGQLPSGGYVDLGLGWMHTVQNNMEDAAICMRESIRKGKLWNFPDIQLYSYLGLANIQMIIGDFQGAEQSIREAEQIAPKIGSALDQLGIAAHEVKLWLRCGDLTRAGAWAAQRNFDPHNIDYYHEIEYFILASIYHTQGHHCEALTMLDAIVPVAEKAQRISALLEILALRVVVLAMAQNIEVALRALEELMAMTWTEGYTRLYLHHGEAMRSLLTIFIDRQGQQNVARATQLLRDYTRTLLAAFESQEQRHDSTENSARQTSTATTCKQEQLLEALSERELEVLSLLANGDSNQQIADKLIVTLSTIKKHVGNILDKLTVTSRTQAILRARELGLLE